MKFKAVAQDIELYASKLLKIATKKPGELVPLTLNSCQRRLLGRINWIRGQGRAPRVVVLKARQTGVSTLTQALLFHAVHTIPHYNALVLAHKTESAQHLFGMSKRFYENLPKDLQFKRKYSTKRMIQFEPPLDSNLQVEVVGQVRGYTPQGVHLSEFAFYDNAQTLMTAVLNSVPTIPESLVVVESSPNGWGNAFHQLWLRAKSGKGDFEAFFIPWFEDPDYRMFTDLDYKNLDEVELDLLEKYDLSLEQLAWRRYKIDTDFNGDVEYFNQEYPSNDIECFLMSGRPVYRQKSLLQYYEEAPTEEELPPKMELEPGANAEGIVSEKTPLLLPESHGRLRIYIPKRPRRQYCQGVDTSAGDPGSDPCALVVIDRHNLDVCAVWHGRVPPEELARYSAMLGYYYNECLINGESNNHGLLFLHELRRYYNHLYYRQTSADSTSGKVTDKLGWYSSDKTRTHAFNLSRKYINKRMGRIYDRALLAEAEGMQFDENERPRHGDGKYDHDDRLCAFNMALAGHHGNEEYLDLEPLPFREVQEARRQLSRRVLLGETPDQVLHPMGMTAEDLEEADLREYKREQKRLRSGFGEEI